MKAYIRRPQILLTGALCILMTLFFSLRPFESSNAPVYNWVRCYQVLVNCGGPNSYDVYFCNGCSIQMCTEYSESGRCSIEVQANPK
jgi:hypothetical protein